MAEILESPQQPVRHRRVTPATGFLVVLALLGALWGAEFLAEGRHHAADFERVSPDTRGVVRIHTADLAPLQVRYFRFLNAGNQEVKLFVGRDPGGHLQVAFDASEVCAKTKRGFRHEGEWMVCNKCDKAFRLVEINAGGGGCKPVPVPFREGGGEIQLAEADILRGWRLFH